MLSRRVFSGLYFLSAACALVLEVVWTRQLATILGSTTLATACVLAAFLAGLAGGAWVGMLLGDRLSRPLGAFALVQLVSAAAAYLPSGVSVSWGAAVSFALGLAAVVVGALPLGLAFPVAARVRQLDGTGFSGANGRLYALDTTGALVGCLAAGIFFVPAIGLSACLLVVVMIKGFVAVACLLLPRGGGRAPQVERRGRGVGRLDMYLLVAVQGFCLLGAENLWSRMLGFVLFKGSTTYAFVAMLATVLGGTGLGAWIAGLLGRNEGAARKWAVLGALLSGLGLLWSLALLLVVGPVPTQAAIGPVDVLITLVACGPASFFSGLVFSAACRVLERGSAARIAGGLLGANTLAAVAGALLVPLVFVETFGISLSLGALGVVLVTASFMVSLREGRSGWWAPAVATAAAVFLCLAGPRWTRHLGRQVFYHEGRDVSVAVVEESPGLRRLFVDGIAVAGTDLIMATDQKTLAHLPLVLHPAPKTALTVGFGSGGTSYSMLLHPDLRVECVEISRSVLLAAPYIEAANQGLLQSENPRYELHLADARRFLSVTDRCWDVIVNDCTDLAYRSDASLYTREFFSLVRDHLNDGGIAAAWVPLRGQPPYRVLASVIGTFASVFDNVSLWVFDAYPSHFGILVGAGSVPLLDLGRFATGLEVSAVRSDLAKIGLADPARLAAARHFGDRKLRAISAGVSLHTDNRPVVEFWAPHESGADTSAYGFLEKAGQGSPPLLQAGSSRQMRELGERILVRPWLIAGHRAFTAGDEGLARIYYLRALRLNPVDPVPRTLLGLRARLFASTSDTDQRRASLARAAGYLCEGRGRLALDALDPLKRKSAPDARVTLAIAMAYLQVGEPALARDAFEEVRRHSNQEELRKRARLGLALARMPEWVARLVQALTFAGL